MDIEYKFHWDFKEIPTTEPLLLMLGGCDQWHLYCGEWGLAELSHRGGKTWEITYLLFESHEKTPKIRVGRTWTSGQKYYVNGKLVKQDHPDLSVFKHEVETFCREQLHLLKIGPLTDHPLTKHQKIPLFIT